MGSVVDAELRVFGCEELRIVDASVMPSITRGVIQQVGDRQAHPGAGLGA